MHPLDGFLRAANGDNREMTNIQPWIRRLAWSHALTRTAIGTSMLLSPGRVGRPWVGDLDTAAARVTQPAFAVRDTAIGIGIVYSLRQHHPVRHRFILGIALELVDLAATVPNRDRLPAGRFPDVGE